MSVPPILLTTRTVGALLAVTATLSAMYWQNSAAITRLREDMKIVQTKVDEAQREIQELKLRMQLGR